MQTLYEQDNAWEFNDKELQRLGIDYQGKVILAVRADLWFPYSSANVTVSVAYYLKGDSTPHYSNSSIDKIEKIWYNRKQR
jgi:hypothetical protein